MLKIRLRPRALFGPLYWMIFFLLLAFFVSLCVRLIEKSLSPSDPLFPYLTNNILAGFIVSGVLYLLTLFVAFLRKGALYGVVIGDDRTVFNWSELRRAFDPDASCIELREWGWRLRGGPDRELLKIEI